jgi:hypothetical protein
MPTRKRRLSTVPPAANVGYYGALVLKIKNHSPPLRLGRLYSRGGRRQGRKALRFARFTVARDVATQVARGVAGEGAGVEAIPARPIWKGDVKRGKRPRRTLGK